MTSSVSQQNPHQAAVNFLASLDADWAQLIASVGACNFKPKPAREPYEALIRAIAYQQLHTKAGDAIIGRLVNGFDNQFPTPQQLLDLDFDVLRACGFSARKIDTIHHIASATLSGVVPNSKEAKCLSDDQLIARLISLKGIGRWTVEMLLMFTLDRPDILPADDFAIRGGYQRLKKCSTAPKPKEMALLGKDWSPYRTIASWYLWRVPK